MSIPFVMPFPIMMPSAQFEGINAPILTALLQANIVVLALVVILAIIMFVVRPSLNSKNSGSDKILTMMQAQLNVLTAQQTTISGLQESNRGRDEEQHKQTMILQELVLSSQRNERANRSTARTSQARIVQAEKTAQAILTLPEILNQQRAESLQGVERMVDTKLVALRNDIEDIKKTLNEMRADATKTNETLVSRFDSVLERIDLVLNQAVEPPASNEVSPQPETPAAAESPVTETKPEENDREDPS